ncbi:MAG: ATP-grasp domain-containing protein [Lachnospiraceae bacterium]|nr:ATP-grasp domain-containing protein [Lachnospiraceae bacterium]
MVDLILFPSSFFSVNKVDEDLQAEYDAVVSTGLFDIALFSYDKWFNEGKLIVKGVPEEIRQAVYRGWMMKPEQYKLFYEKLLEKNIRLVTEPEQYKLMHIFTNVYPLLKADTAKMEVYLLHEQLDIEQLKKSFDRFMVKDFVKSVKGTEFPQYFDQSINQESFDRWMEVFYKYRGELLTGGICIKEFLSLKRYNGRTNEYRVFYINHEVATISRNSAQAIYAPLPPKELIEKYNNLDSIYYTIDYAELDDGTWKIFAKE